MNQRAPNEALREAMSGACICRRARRTANRLTRFYDARLAPHGLTVGQFGILTTLAATEGTNVQHIADVLDMSQSALSRGLAPLERDGLIASEPDPVDRRKRRLALTGEGLERLNRAAETWAGAQAEIAARIEAADAALDEIIGGIAKLGRAAA